MNIKPCIQFASHQDIYEVQKLLEENELGLAGDIEDHVIVRWEGVVCAAAKLCQTGIDRFHLEVIGVRDDQHGDGLGTLLLSKLTSAPWNYCHPKAIPMLGKYQVTCVAKGNAVHFYRKLGFVACSFSGLASKYAEQCDNCPDQETCGPLPMIFVSVNN